jgi:hypothetical protein
MKATKFCLAICLILQTISCFSKPENVLLGKWQSIYSNETIELLKDGTVTINNPKGKSATGDFKLADDEHIRIEFKGLRGLGDPVVFKFSVSGDELSLTFPDGKGSKYRRVK